MLKVIQCIYHKFLAYMTPIKITATSIILMVSFTNVTNPFYHGLAGVTETFINLPELFMKSLFLFLALFSLFGNGSTVRLRLIFVMIPMLYYDISYVAKFMQTNAQSLLVPMLLLLSYSLWVFLTGEHYAHANKRYFDSGLSDFNRICSELGSKALREE